MYAIRSYYGPARVAPSVSRRGRSLAAHIAICADVGGKHAVPLAPTDIAQTARDLVHRGLADVLVVSGPATGEALQQGREKVNAIEDTRKAVSYNFV